MDEKTVEELKTLRDATEDILSLDNDFLKEKMKEDPDDIIVTMRAGFIVLHQFLEQAIKEL